MDQTKDTTVNKLTDKQRAFIEAYTTSEGNRNITKSAIIAGFSPHTANAIGSRLLRRKDIRAIVDSRLNLTYDAWRQEGIDAYRQLELKSPVRVRYWELVGKSAGWLKDNEVTINHLSVSNDDIARLRKSLANKGIEQPVDNLLVNHSEGMKECEQPVDNLCIERGEGREGEEPPATPLDMHSTPNQNAHKIEVDYNKIDDAI